MSRRAAAPGAPRAGADAARLAAAAALLLAFLALAYGDALRMPFLNDDYLFLDRVRAAPFASLWRLSPVAFHWWRPWSRELHYWWLTRAFGPREPVFHAANLGLWLAVIGAYFALVRRAAGRAAAAWAAAAAAALAAWGLPLLWTAGVQDLWMLLAALLALHAWDRGRPGWTALAYALALLSKETAAPLPLALLAWSVALRRRPAAATLRALAPVLAVAAAWALVHPRLGGQLLHPQPVESAPAEVRVPAFVALARGLLAALNLDAWPRPADGWARALAAGAPAAALLAAAAWLAWPRAATGGRGAAAPGGAGGVAVAGGAWAAAGLAPLLLPGLGFHAYYALLGALGALCALAPLAARARAPALAAVAALALLGAARAHTPSTDWGDAWYQRRAGSIVRALRTDLERRWPAFPPHARLYFVRVPERVGFLSGDGPALRVWYRDSTLRAGFYSAYRPRAAGAPAGPDYFFRLDPLAGWVRIVAGPEDVAAARAADPRWATDHHALAAAFAAGGDWPRAGDEYAKLARALPQAAGPAFAAAVCRSAAGDTTAAAAWLREAARRPDATPAIVAAARAAGLAPPAPPGGRGSPPRR